MSEAKTSEQVFDGNDPVSVALNEFYQELELKEKAYLSLRIHLIRPDAVPDISFYVQRGQSYRLFRKDSNKFHSYEIKALLDVGIDRVYLARKDAEEIREYLETFLIIPPHNENIPMNAQASLLRSNAVRMTKELFADPSPKNIRKGMRVVASFVNVLLRDPNSFYYLINLSSHDEYTYQHSVGASLNAIALAKKLQINNPADLMDLGVAGLLHDIGKTKVNPAIINKPGPLDESEWAEMQQHSKWSYELVAENEDIPKRVKLAVRHHHEEPSGKGYPDGLIDNEISTYAKIVTIADIFNALTTDRTYAKAMSPFDAFKLMDSKLSQKFDYELFRSLVLIYGGNLE